MRILIQYVDCEIPILIPDLTVSTFDQNHRREVKIIENEDKTVSLQEAFTCISLVQKVEKPPFLYQSFSAMNRT